MVLGPWVSKGLQQLQVLGVYQVCRGGAVLDYSHCKWDVLYDALQHQTRRTIASMYQMFLSQVL